MLKTLQHFVGAAAVTLVAGTLFSAQTQAQTPAAEGARLSVSGNGFSGQAAARTATAADLGLAVYPGAVPQRDQAEDSASANLDLNWSSSGGSFGFRLVVLKFASRDAPADVAAYYRRELARYGEVLDCGIRPHRCGKDVPGPGELRYKVGTKQQFRMVAVQADGGGGTRFQLLRVELPD